MSQFLDDIEKNIIQMRRARIQFCQVRKQATLHQRKDFDEWRISAQAVQLIQSQLKKLGGICPVCQRSLNEYQATIDHLEPLSRTYHKAMDEENFLVMCGTCNKEKFNYPFAQWRLSLSDEQRMSIDYAICLIHGEARLHKLIR